MSQKICAKMKIEFNKNSIEKHFFLFLTQSFHPLKRDVICFDTGGVNVMSPYELEHKP